MNHRERIKAVLGGEQPDRIPVATWGHDFLREWSAEDLTAHTIARHRKYDYDFVKLNPRWTMFAEPWGNVYQPPTEQKFPRLLSKMANSLDDIAKLKKASPSHPVFVQHVDAMKLVVGEIGDDVDVIATLFSPLSVLGLLCGGVGEPLISYAKESPRSFTRYSRTLLKRCAHMLTSLSMLEPVACFMRRCNGQALTFVMMLFTANLAGHTT